MYETLQVGGLTVLEAVILLLFLTLFAWIALSFVSCLVGFLLGLAAPIQVLGIGLEEQRPELSSQTALLLPTYNENPAHIAARLQAMWESIAQTGNLPRFDFYVLSDTTDPGLWVAEEAEFLRLRRTLPDSRIFYRHRCSNVARKAGNIAGWVARFGGCYQHMIVLDADSLMCGDTLVRLVAMMERNPDAGLIQTLPVLLNGETLFARLQQFAGRVYGPLIARGIAWWHGTESNYWGHNAIIRVKAFAEQAGLPLLPGPKPFGGHILSHDFVEAALLRRGGWSIYFVPALGGSFEECPPTLTDFASRDRRWCQGNLQHLGVLPARGLHWVSRLHLLTGIGSYITAPLWLLFLFVGILISLQAQYVRPEYFPSGATLFPQWPAQDPIRAAWVFAATMAMLIVPKLLGYVSMLGRRSDRIGMGGAIRGAGAVVLEIIVSALVAPVLMLHQSKAISEILIGRDSGWGAQRRDGSGFSLNKICRQYATTTVLGIALAISAYMVSVSLLFWMSPVIAGLLLSIPIAALTSMKAAGQVLRRAGLLATPEECLPPPVAARADALLRAGAGCEPSAPITLLAGSPELLQLHLRALPETAPPTPGKIDVNLAVALAKIDTGLDLEQISNHLSNQEIFAVLANTAAVNRVTAMDQTLKLL
jgi:membrane glycosyltransferase